MGQSQLLSGNIVDALYASENSAYPPTATNKVITADDTTAGGLVKPSVSEVAFTTNIVDTRAGSGAMTSVQTINFPVNPLVTDGRSRRIVYTATYTKTTGVSTTQFRLLVGGMTLTFASTAIGNTARTLDTYTIEIRINFRAGNTAEVTGLIQRRDDNVGTPLEFLTVSAVPAGTWDKTIANSVSLQWQVVTGTATHVLTLRQVTSELI